MKPDDIQFARTKLLCLENTQSGRVLPLDYLSAARDFVTSRALCLHLDGARVFNAVVKLEIPVNQIARMGPFLMRSIRMTSWTSAVMSPLMALI